MKKITIKNPQQGKAGYTFKEIERKECGKAAIGYVVEAPLCKEHSEEVRRVLLHDYRESKEHYTGGE